MFLFCSWLWGCTGQSHPNHVDWVSVVSILLSIVSIVSKSYIVSISMVRSIFSFKMMCICFDVVSLFYIFASLFLATEDTGNTVVLPWLGRPVDILSAAWLAQVIVFAGWLFALFMVIGLDTTLGHWRKAMHAPHNHSEGSLDLLVQSVGLLIIAVAMWLPLMVVLCATNFSFFLLLLRALEEPFLEAYYPLYNNVLRLLHGPDFKTKLQAYNMVAIQAQHGQVWASPNPRLHGRGAALMMVCSKNDLKLRDLRVASQVAFSWKKMFTDFASDTKEMVDDRVQMGMYQQRESFSSRLAAKCCFQARLCLLRFAIMFTTLLYVLLSVSTVLYPPASFALALRAKFTGQTSWSGVHVFQTMLYLASLLLLLGIASKAYSVVPWYVRALRHMVPISRRHQNVQDAMGLPKSQDDYDLASCYDMDLYPRHHRTAKAQHDAGELLDLIFRHTVTLYCERSGRSENDVMLEVKEHADNGDTTATAYLMEFLHVIGRAA